MCFSATASFIAGGSLSAAGAETLRHAKSRERVPLAAMPLLFGIQQLIEGVVWLTFRIPLINTIATHFFVFFSHVLWPTYVPFSVYLIEKDPGRRLILRVLLLIGVATSLNLLFHTLIAGTPIAFVQGESIVYETTIPPIPLGVGFYVLATCVACFVSSHKFIRVFGMALLGSFVISYWSYNHAFYSVWCFFAAILSFIIYVHLRTDVVEKVRARARVLRGRVEEEVRKRVKK